MKLMKCKNYESKNTGGSRQYSYNVNPPQNKTRCWPERKKVCNKGSRNVTLIVIDISFGREQRHLDLDLETMARVWTADTVATLRTGQEARNEPLAKFHNHGNAFTFKNLLRHTLC